MKCIETDCSSFYIDPASQECVLGSLVEPFLESEQKNEGITVYRNKNLKELGRYSQNFYEIFKNIFKIFIKVFKPC